MERRAYARLAYPVKVDLKIAGQSISLLARDISRGGIFLFTTFVVDVDSKVGVVLHPPDGGEPLELAGEVVRLVEAPQEEGGGLQGIGVQWGTLSPANERRLDQLMHQLLWGGSGGDRRAHPRLAAMLNIVCRTDQDINALVRDISQGGMLMTVHRPIALGSEVEVQVDVPPAPSVSLRARVRRCERPKNQIPFSIGLEFDIQSEQVRDALHVLIKQLARN